MRLLVLPLAVADIALAMFVFVLFARPERLIGWFSAWTGDTRAWEEGRLDESGRQRLLRVVERARYPFLALLFAWSFLCGAALTWLRL